MCGIQVPEENIEILFKNVKQYHCSSSKNANTFEKTISEFILTTDGNLYLKKNGLFSCEYEKIQENVHEIFDTNPHSILMFSKIA